MIYPIFKWHKTITQNPGSKEKKQIKNCAQSEKKESSDLILKNDIKTDVFIKESKSEPTKKENTKESSYWDYYDVIYLGL